MKSWVFLVLIFAASPIQAEEDLFADGPYLGIGIQVASLVGCSQASRSDLSSHCYVGLITGTWATIFSKNPWIGTAIGCGLGAAKEAYDKNNGGVADGEDFAYTCGSAALSSYAMDNILTFYAVGKTPMVGIQKKF